MKKPWVLALAAGVIVLLVAFALPLLHMGQGAGPSGEREATGGLPWHVTVLPNGHAQVFGLVPGRDTLAEARGRMGDAMQVALVSRLGEQGALEALVDPFAAGFVSGRLVLAFDAPAAQLERWRAQATGSEVMEGGARRFNLRAADLDEAGRAHLVGLSFIPAAQLVEADVRQRFGAPAEVLAQPGGVRVLLYPEQGLSIGVAEGQRGVLQYVAPVDFATRLRAPLLAAAAAPVATR
jgi:hypothetical protein